MTEDEMVARHHCLNGHEFEQARGVGDGQGSLAYLGPWGRKEWGATELRKKTSSQYLFVPALYMHSVPELY